MATSNIWYLLVDHKNQPLRPPSSVSRLGIEYVVDLKEKVKEKEQPDRPASELEVWRCQNQEMRFVREDVRAHVQEVFFKDQVEYLGEQSEIAVLQLKNKEILLIRVPAPAPIHLGIDTSVAFNSHRSKLSGPNFAEFYDRSDTIKAMASQLLTDRFMLVRGTSGSGKTILMWFLKRYIETHIEGALTEVFMGWEQTPDRLSRRGRSGTLSLSEALTHPEREKIFIFMDDAQDTYSDHSLWNHTLKSVVLKQQRLHLVMFASYGSSRQRKSSISAAPPIIPSTHIMGLFPTPYNSLQILFNPEEYQHLINHIDRMIESNQETRMSSVEDDFKEHIYTLTKGHVGAIVTLLTMARSMQKGAASAKVSFRDFFKFWNTPRLFFNGLSTNNGSFCRGLPRKDQLAKLNEMELKILKDIVKNDYQGIPASPPTSFPISNIAYKDAVDALRRRGWLYSYESHEDPERYVLVASSPLHLFWLSYQLGQRSLPGHLKELSLKDFWMQVVALFSSTALAEPRRSGTMPEARYAYEFYRCLYELTDGAFCPSPEFAQMEQPPYGRIDFFIEEKRWGIELLRNGDRIIEHGDAQRFEPGGKYNGWFQTDVMRDYVILDFRTKNSGVCRTYPGVERLYQIIFEEDYTSFQIYDHMGNPVGDFVLALRR